MKDTLQNKINGAISRGVKLGINLYDDCFQDIDLEKDLQDTQIQKEFIALDPFKDLDERVENLLKGDQKQIWIFRVLCHDYNDSFYKKFYYKNKETLYSLIRRLCLHFGGKINLNWIDIGNLQDMVSLFENTEFNGDISQWDVSNVRDMADMFRGSRFNGDISQWDVSNVKNMTGMFHSSSFTGDISAWDVSNVENMAHMFSWSIFNGDISKWDVSNVKNMDDMFSNALFNKDISTWDVSNVKQMNWMFYDSAFNQDISKWNILSIHEPRYIFLNSKIDSEKLPKQYNKYEE